MEGQIELFKTVITTIVVVYVAFILIQSLSQDTPGFSQYGWVVFGALVAGVVFFFKYILFR